MSAIVEVGDNVLSQFIGLDKNPLREKNLNNIIDI